MGLLLCAGCASGSAGSASVVQREGVGRGRHREVSAARLAVERPARVALSGSSPVVVKGDWEVGVTVTTGTDSRYDTVNNRERAWRIEDDEAQAKRRGEHHQDPVSKMVLRRPPVYAPSAGDRVMWGLKAAQAAAQPLSVWDPIGRRYVTLLQRR